MGIIYVLQGILVGVLVSAPVGPIAVLCIQKTLNQGRYAGYITGFGAAAADTVYAVIAGFGITFITNFLTDQQMYIRIIGGAVIVAFGVKMFFTNTVKQARAIRQGKRTSSFGDFIAVFLLTISNPMTIIAFGVFFTAFGFVVEESGFLSVLYLVFGVFIGTILWWFGLVTVTDRFRQRVRLKKLFWINKIFGVTVVLFG
ncbi:MAG: LysE family translocator, partial [Bacteroidetes bacterium]|nr:LysE family translocator [Bacteroidota bacterium]